MFYSAPSGGFRHELSFCQCLSTVFVFLVPPLEGFVMNRVLGDYLETLLYKIFVSIDEHTTVSEVGASLTTQMMWLESLQNLHGK